MLAKNFLTAEWRWLVMLNYEVDPALLQPYVPAGTELDWWNGRCYASMVGFLFLNTRLLRLPIPYHTDFEEVNLRFYVRRHGPDGWRRGVVFIKEIVPRWAIAAVARGVYNERYVAQPMRHVVSLTEQGGYAEYGWRLPGGWQRLGVEVSGAPQPIADGSEAEFITEHYWGYASQRDGGTVEYRVEHPRWRVWQADVFHFDCDIVTQYGPQFAEPLSGVPTSAFMAEGSAVAVRPGVRI